MNKMQYNSDSGLLVKNQQRREKNMDRHELGDPNIFDSNTDKVNNALVINKYIPAINALNKTFADPDSYSIEVVKLMQTIGYAVNGSNNKPVITFLSQTTANNLIQILESLKP